MNRDTNKLLESLKGRLGEAALTYSVARPHVGALLKTIEPTTRKDTLKRIAQAIPSYPVLMAWFQQRLADPMSKGKLSVYSVLDTFGEPLLVWKDRNDISDDDSEWADMSSDLFFLKEVEKVVQAAAPATVAGQDTRDYANASVKLERLTSLVRSLVRNGGNDKVRAEATALCAEVMDILK